MMKRKLVILIALLSLAGSGAPALAEEGGPGEQQAQRLVEEISGLKRSLDDIARALDSLLAKQSIDLVFKRIELAERRLAPMERELRGARSNVRSVEEDVERMRQMLEQVEFEIAQDLKRGTDSADSDNRSLKRNLERELELQQDQLDDAERRVSELEIELAHGRKEIEILDETLQELLEELPW